MRQKNNILWPLVVVGIVLIFVIMFFITSNNISGYWMMGPWMFFPFFFIVGIGFMIYFMSNGGPMGCGHNNHQTKEEDPFEILKNRYAKGEINKEKFEEMKKDLKE